jgi:ABC-type amino acid transport substrate-binding protein
MLEASRKKKPYPYTVGTPIVGADLYDIPISIQTSIEGSMKMVDAGRLDAFIMTQDEGDRLVRKLDLKNTRRNLYAVLPVHFVVAKGPRGKKADEILTKVLEEMKKRGTLKKLSTSVHKTTEYIDWQP